MQSRAGSKRHPLKDNHDLRRFKADGANENGGGGGEEVLLADEEERAETRPARTSEFTFTGK